MFPKNLKLAMEYTVLHSHRPGEKPFYQGTEASSFGSSGGGLSEADIDQIIEDYQRRKMGIF